MPQTGQSVTLRDVRAVACPETLCKARVGEPCRDLRSAMRGAYIPVKAMRPGRWTIARERKAGR